MNILLSKYSLFVGGAEKQLLLIANALQEDGNKVFVLFNSGDKEFLERFDNGIELISLPQKSFFGKTRFTISLVRKKQIDIIHAWELISVLMGLAAQFLSKAVLLNGSLRSAPSHHIFKKLWRMNWQRRIAKYCNLYCGIAVLSNSRAGLKAYGIENRKNTFVLHNGYISDTGEYQSQEDDSFIRIGMVANMRWKKDFGTLIQAGNQLCSKYKNLKFYLVGDGPDKDKYLTTVNDSEYKDCYVFTGKVTNVLQMVSNFDICTLINDISGEGISNSIMEYMSLGKPVVATDMGGNSELVLDGKTGFLVPAYDVEKLVASLEKLILSKELRNQLGKAGNTYLREEFNTKKMTSNILNIYQSINNKKS